MVVTNELKFSMAVTSGLKLLKPVVSEFKVLLNMTVLLDVICALAGLAMGATHFPKTNNSNGKLN